MSAHLRERELTTRCRIGLSPAVMVLAVLLPAGHLESAEVARTVVVREHAGWDRNCNAIPHPALYLVTPPSHGKVCAMPQEISIKSIYEGTESQCIGRKVSGVRLIYQPDASYSGEDALVYGVQYPSHLRATSVKVNTSVTAPASVSISDADPGAQLRQTPGPMPSCPQFVF